MLRELLSYIRKHDLLHAGDRIGVAVSGGADSVALLRALLEMRGELGIVLSVVHVHHGIRGALADADAEFVCELARAWNLELHLRHADVPAIARSERLSIEAAGREVRYGYFAELVSEGKLDRVATAHTFDDQAETVLLRLIRGAGLRGLSGIHVSLRTAGGKAPYVIRPLLGTTRPEIEEYLQAVKQPWREDHTNTDRKFLRNRIRHELLPLLERDYNPGIRDALNNLAEISRAEDELLSGHSQEAIAASGGVKDGVWQLGLISDLPVALQRRVLREAAAHSTGLRLDFEEVERLRELLSDGGSLQVEAGIRAKVERTKAGTVLRFLQGEDSSAAAEPADYDYVLPVPGEVQVAEVGSVVRATLVTHAGTLRGYNPANLIDHSRLNGPLRLRNWRPGDRFHPLHTKSTEKLKRLFQKRKIPLIARRSWPVVLHGEEIVWVRGFSVSAEYALRPNSSAAVLIEDSAESGEGSK